MRIKITLNSNFVIKATDIRNNNGLSILTIELWRKRKEWPKKYENISFVPKDIQGIPSSHKVSEKYNEQVFCIKSCT